MIANFDYFNRFEQPIISLRKPNDKFIGFLSNVKNLNINPEFNAVSEMTCDVYEYGEDNEKLKIYDDIKVKRQLFVEEVGFFIITECNEHDDNEGKYKSLTLYSCEHEISYKKLTYFNGTYKFWDASSPKESLMGQILNSLPRWSIGHVDETVAEKYRTFDEPDTTIYSFLMDDVEESYECLFEFDIINRIINVYDKNNYIHKTSILLTKNDVIESISVNTKAEEIFTALSLYGDDEITYSGINPLGGAVVYNFDYYKSDMSEELQEALNVWEENILEAELSISSLRTDLSNKYTEKQSIQSQIDSINEQITLLEKQLGVNTLDAEVVSSLTSQIKEKRTELSNVQSSMDKKQAEIDAINVELNIIHESCSFENNFTTEQLSELDAYIFECSEVDDTFAFTDDMNYEEQEEILVELYNKAKSMLVDISTPTEELSLDSKSFIFQKEFLPYTEQLNTGVIVDIEDGNENILSYVLLKMDVNYQDKTLELTFGNKYRTSDANAIWNDWESDVSKSSTTLSYERSKYGKAVNSGSLDKMNAFMNSSLDLTLNQVKSSDGQSFEVTDSGIKGRRVDLTTGQVDKEQIWLTANSIVFTDDAWETIKTAIGRLLLADGSIGYGVNAEYLIGKMILGNNMNIANKKGSVEINEGITITTKHDGTVNNALLVQRENEDGTLQKQMHIDSNGNIVLTNGAVIEGSGVTVQQADGSTMTFVDYIQANSITAEQIEAIKAEIMSAVIKDLSAEFATIEQLNTLNATVEGKLDAKDLEAEVGKFGYISADDATFKEMQSDIGKIDTLIFGSAGGTSIQTEFSNSVIAQLGDAQIKSAMIEDMSVDKLKAGTMYTDDITIASKSGNTILSDNTLQFSDDTRVRIQIGKDASGDYSISLWDEDGNLMLSKGGITDAAIKEAIIRNDMISDDANIDAGKLDIDSLFTEINGSSNTIKSTKIYLDDKKQTLDVSFKEMSTTVEDLESTQKSQGTDISVIQGQIESKIWEQDIENVKVTNSVNGTTPLALENSADGKVIDFSMSGKTTQRTTSGKNLLKNSATSVTENGVTFTVNADGSITVVGTATSDTYLNLSFNDAIQFLDTPLKASLNSSDASLSMTVGYFKGDGSYVDYHVAVAKAERDFSFPSEATSTRIYLKVIKGYALNETVYPMIRLASNTDSTYEPYTNGASPNPDYPQSLNHTGDCVEIEQGTITKGNGVTSSATNRVRSKHYVHCNGGDSISIRTEDTMALFGFYYYDDNNTYISEELTTTLGNSFTGTVPSGATKFKFAIGKGTDVSPDTVGKILLTINGKYVLQFKTNGKNLFNANAIISGYELMSTNGTLTRNTEFFVSDYMPISPNTSFYLTKGNRGASICFYDKDMNYISTVTKTKGVVTSPNNENVAYMRINGYLPELEGVQVELGTVATEYEPYKETVATVLLDAPLCETDVMSRTEVARKRVYLVYDGSDDEKWQSSSSVAGRYLISTNGLAKPASLGWCSQAKSTSETTVVNCYYITASSQIAINTNFSTLDEWKAHLQESPIEFVCELVTPTTETLDTDSQIALNSLETFDTVTYINVDSRVQPSEMSVDYYLNTEEGKRLAKENANTESELSKLATRYSITEQTLNGISTTVGSHTSLINGLDTRVSATETKYVQLDNKFSWIVSGESQSSFTLTSEMAKLVSDSLVITDDSGSSTIISGGKIDLDELFAQDITATKLNITGESTFKGRIKGSTIEGSTIISEEEGWGAIKISDCCMSVFDYAVSDKIEFGYIALGSDPETGVQKVFGISGGDTAIHLCSNYLRVLNSNYTQLEISSSGTITAGGEIISTNAHSNRIIQGDYGTFWRNDGQTLYLMFTPSGDQYGAWNDLRPLYFNLASGTAYFGHSVNVSGDTVFNATVYHNWHMVLNNYKVLYGQKSDGSLIDMLSVNVDNSCCVCWGPTPLLHIGHPSQVSRVQMFSSTRIDFLAGGVADSNGYAISIVYEDNRPFIRPTQDGGASAGTASYRMHTAYLSVDPVVGSDRRLKNNIVDLDNRHMELAKLLTAKSYFLNVEENGRRHMGYVAQDVEEAMKTVGLTYEECSFFNRNWVEREDYIGYELSLTYEELHTVQIASLQQQVNELQNELVIANAKIEQLQSQQLGY